MSDQTVPPQASSDSRYLERLRFDSALRHGFFNFFVSNVRVVLLLIILILGWGIYAYSQLPRESNPEVKIPVALVTTTFSGASPSDVEELVTKKIETGLATLKDVKTITSTSANSFSSISVEFEANADLENSIRSVRDKVTTVIKDLPADADAPTVNEVSFDDQPILTYALTGPYDGLTLREYADTLHDELEKIPDVRQVNVSGGDEREFSVAYDPAKLAAYGISATTANQAIASTNRAIPGGNFDGQQYSYPVRADARFFEAATLGNVLVLHTTEGSAVYLRDVARVEETAIKRTVLSRLSVSGSEPENSVSLAIVKKTGGSILNTVSSSNAVMQAEVPTFASGMHYAVTEDFSEQITRDFDQLGHDFLLTIILVMAALFLIVGLKEALIAGLAIPLVFSITFGIMQLTGTSLNFLSLFSLLLSLGLLVDDAIVVVSATKQYMKSGKFTPEEAILLVLRDFRIVLLTTTLATTWAFLPLLLSTGMIGAFIKSIPITVSVTLLSSLVVALVINHPLAAVLERVRFTRNWYWLSVVTLLAFGGWLAHFRTFLLLSLAGAMFAVSAWLFWWYFRGDGRRVTGDNRTLVARERSDEELIKRKLREQGSDAESSLGNRLVHGVIRFDRIIPVYERSLRYVLSTRRHRVTTLLATLALFIVAIVLPVVGLVKTEFFPPSDEDLLFLNVTAPAGLKLSETDAIMRRVETQLRRYPEIINFSTIVGQPGVSPNRAGGGSGGDTSNKANVTIKLNRPEERHVTSSDLAQKIQSDLGAIVTDADVTVESQQGGPPSGAAFEAHISGDNLQELDRIATDLKGTLVMIPGVANVDTSLKPAPADYTFTLDPVRLEFYGLDATSVGSTIRMAIAGTEVTTVLRDNKEIKVRATFDTEKIPRLEDVGNLQIVNRSGQPVSLKDVSTITLQPSIDSITRIDQKRTVLLSSGVATGARSNEILAEFQQRIQGYQLPVGYAITYGGENEQNQESVASILRAMLIAGLLIVSTMVFQFNSFRQSFIVLVTLPLALIGVFVGLALFQVPLSFPGLIGILALFGIVVKNAIILIDKINLNIRSGIVFDEAIIDAGKSRIEAIFITSICTIFGILPITLSNALWKALGSAVIFGLSLSSFLTLFIVPVLFVVLLRPEKVTTERMLGQ